MRVSPTGVARQAQVITLLEDYFWNPRTTPTLTLDIPSSAWGRNAVLEIRGDAIDGRGAHCLLVYQADTPSGSWPDISYGLVFPWGPMRISYPIELLYGKSRIVLRTDTPGRFQVDRLSLRLIMR
jgi:hypothetical protein